MFFWHVPNPNEALLISGSKRWHQDTQFRVVTGHGSFVMPVKQRARRPSLALQEAEIVEDCITNQGIRLNVRAVAAFKVGDDPVSIANAARRFLSEQDRMETQVGRIFAGHLRSIVGGLTVEQIIRERDRVAQEIKDGSHTEMRALAEAERDRAKYAAEGEAYRRTTIANADAEAAKIQADAAAYAERATAQARADANRSRAASLAGGNQELLAASRIVEVLPSLVASAAQGLADSRLTILNGTDGVGQVVTGLVGQGLSVLDTLRSSTAAAAEARRNSSPRPVAAASLAPAEESGPATLTEAARSDDGGRDT